MIFKLCEVRIEVDFLGYLFQAESNRIRDDILADKTLMKEIQALRTEMKHEKNQRMHLESQILQALQVRPEVEKMRVDLMNAVMDLKLNLSAKMDAEIQHRNESMEEIRMDLDNALGLNHYDMILMQSDFDAKFLNLSQVLQQEKDMRILLSRELFELSFLKVIYYFILVPKNTEKIFQKSLNF